jgi:hypothetical protein
MERREDEDRKAKQNMKKIISAAMKDPDTHTNITNQLKRARLGGEPMKPREGFGDDGEVITGNPEDCPWLRE